MQLRASFTCVLLLAIGGCFETSGGDGESDSGSTQASDSTSATTPGDSTTSTPPPTTASTNGETSESTTTSTTTDEATESSAESTSTSEGTGTTVGSTTDSDGESSTGDPPPRMCNPLGDTCGPNEFCDAPDCNSNGVCAPRPQSSSAAYAPVCGCDGLIYWNSQHANFVGRPAFPPPSGGDPTLTCFLGGVAPQSCDANGNGCDAGERCIRRYQQNGSNCEVFDSGYCWRIPDNAGCPECVETEVRQCQPYSCACRCDAILTGRYNFSSSCAD